MAAGANYSCKLKSWFFCSRQEATLKNETALAAFPFSFNFIEKTIIHVDDGHKN
jgi:hypothetical protein